MIFVANYSRDFCDHYPSARRYEMQKNCWTAVVAGMLGATAFGLLFTPAFYAIVRKISRAKLTTANKATSSSDITPPTSARPLAVDD